MPKDKTPAPATSRKDPVATSIFFYHLRGSRYGVFSQWHKHPFTVTQTSLSYLHPSSTPPTTTDEPSDAPPTTLTFSCAEQYMMYAKAVYFSDHAIAARVMATAEPREQKKLGRAVAGFDDERWAAVREKVVEEANLAKFGGLGNEKLRKVLLDTGDAMLYEASPKDRIWGIGFREEEARRMLERGTEKNWGLNLLGKALMRVRARLHEASVASDDISGSC